MEDYQYDPGCFMFMDLIEEALDKLPADLYEIAITQYEIAQNAHFAHANAITCLIEAGGNLEKACAQAEAQNLRNLNEGRGGLPGPTAHDVLEKMRLAKKLQSSNPPMN